VPLKRLQVSMTKGKTAVNREATMGRLNSMRGYACLIIVIATSVVAAELGRRHLAARPLVALGGRVTWSRGGRIVGVDFHGASLADRDLAILTSYPSIRKLDLGYTNVGDGAVRYIEPLEHLTYLNLNGTSLTDNGLKSFRGALKLLYLFLLETKVTNSSVPFLCELERLEYLVIDDVAFTAEDADIIRGALPRLKQFGGVLGSDRD